MVRYLLWTAGAVLGLAPAGVGAGVALETSPGWGVLAGSVAYGAVAVFALLADLLPDVAEVTR